MLTDREYEYFKSLGIIVSICMIILALISIANYSYNKFYLDKNINCEYEYKTECYKAGCSAWGCSYAIVDCNSNNVDLTKQVKEENCYWGTNNDN